MYIYNPRTLQLQPRYYPTAQPKGYIKKDINTKNIFDDIDRGIKAASAPAVLQSMEVKINQQKNDEESYIMKTNICPVNQLEYLRDHINNIDVNKFKELVHDHFYDPAVMKEAMCISNSIFYLKPANPGSFETNDRIREWIQNLKQIGEPSIEGYAMNASLVNNNEAANDIFVLKAPQDPLTDNLIHELFIGLHLDDLRQYVPNFAMVNGGFKCTSPVIDTNKKVVSWCLNTNSSVNYVMYENIQPSVPLGKYVANVSFIQALDKYMQVLYALKTALKKYDYTHYDLHAENVLVWDVDPSNNISIPYYTEKNKIEYLTTDKIAMIIDYGFNHINVNGKHYGIYDRVAYGVNPDRSFPAYDAYKLLMWIVYRMATAGNMEYKKFEPIFRYFNRTDSFEQALSDQAQISFSLPYNRETAAISLDDYLRYIREKVPDVNQIVTEMKPSNRIIGCDGTDICMTQGQVVEMLNINKPITVSTVFQFYDVVSRLEAERRFDDIKDIMSRFDVDMALNQANIRYTNLEKRIEQNKNSLYPVKLNGVSLNTLLVDNNIRSRHMDYVIKVMEIWDLFHTILILADAISYVNRWYNKRDENLENNIDKKLIPTINEFNNSLDEYISIYDYVVELFNKNQDIINNQLDRFNPNARWYWISYPTYTKILTCT